MAKVSTFIYCLGADKPNIPNAPINAIGVLNILTPEFIPSTFSFSIIVGFVGMRDILNHTLSIIFKDNHDLTLLEAKDVNIAIENSDPLVQRLPDDAKGMMVSMDLKNVILREEGTYSTIVSLDGKELGKYEIYVKGKN